MRDPPRAAIGVLLVVIVLVPACRSTTPTEALTLDPESLADRSLQTRRFDTLDETRVLAASVAVLQDIGFIIEEANPGAGLVVGSMSRSGSSAEQKLGDLAITFLCYSGLLYSPDSDLRQELRASVVSRESREPDRGVLVRVTFQRVIWGLSGKEKLREQVDEPEIYRKFFAALSKAVFLEAHEL